MWKTGYESRSWKTGNHPDFSHCLVRHPVPVPAGVELLILRSGEGIVSRVRTGKETRYRKAISSRGKEVRDEYLPFKFP